MRLTRPTRSGAVRPLAILAATAILIAACSSDEAATPEPATAEPTAAATAQTTGGLGTTGTGALTATLTQPQVAPQLADLVYADGSDFDLAEFSGSNTLVFFGYTHCPDVCPQTLGEIFGVFEASPETQAVFISVDPERDTTEFLAEWTQYLPDQLNAVTGSPGAIRRAADNYGVKYARVETTSTSGYTMSHTADVYLIDAAGQLRSSYPFGTPAEDIVADLDRLEAG
jgi:protein SCO1/2